MIRRKQYDMLLLYHVSFPKSNIKVIVVSLVTEETRSSSEWNDSSPFHLGAVDIEELDMSAIRM